MVNNTMQIVHIRQTNEVIYLSFLDEILHEYIRQERIPSCSVNYYYPAILSRCEAPLRNVAGMPVKDACYMTQEGFQAARGKHEKLSVGAVAGK